MIISLLFIGCGKEDKPKETYKAVGDVETIQKTGAMVDGTRSVYAVTFINLQPGSSPDPKDSRKITVSITKNTTIFQSTKGGKQIVDVTALEKGKRAEITWRFANDHLTEATEIMILSTK